jgi:hypothetical protein
VEDKIAPNQEDACEFQSSRHIQKKQFKESKHELLFSRSSWQIEIQNSRAERQSFTREKDRGFFVRYQWY